ncbi:MAG TPA: DUF417 family protein [Candidatus Binatia bacterium]|nr:DUF417 family protein [Candidatus Binatia bacterium]
MDLPAKTRIAADIEAFGLFALRYGLVLILMWIGGMKFTAFEAEGIQPLIKSSFFLRWLYGVFDPSTLSTRLGCIEIAVAFMIALRPYSPKIAALGSLAAAMLFITTFSFLFSLPGWEPRLGGFPALSSAGGFLVKDVCLFAAALWSLGESGSAVKANDSQVTRQGALNKISLRR